ncbi:unnamed protein product [Brugia pahangi]|uniref:Transposase n=1 Tax=Brugia pahangi TaxID=6280 RepID=A0A0N4TWX6_BRUPA|nr:unnamed protein product [Brugia pahangi]
MIRNAIMWRRSPLSESFDLANDIIKITNANN